MTEVQWADLLRLIEGEKMEKPPVGFIIDSPWLPGWYGCQPIDYYSSDSTWMEANLKAVSKYPDVMFLPGFWSEYGEINEPSAFGSKLIWTNENLPHAESIIDEAADVSEHNLLCLRRIERDIRNGDHGIWIEVEAKSGIHSKNDLFKGERVGIIEQFDRDSVRLPPTDPLLDNRIQDPCLAHGFKVVYHAGPDCIFQIKIVRRLYELSNRDGFVMLPK